MASPDEQFDIAAKHFTEMYQQCTDRQKLRMYGLWNQAMNGDNKEKAPSKMNVVKYAKWEAYKRCEGMDKETAKKRYVSELRAIDPTFAIQFDDKAAKAPKTSKKKDKAKDVQKTKKTGEALKKEFEKAASFAFRSSRFKLGNQRTLLYAYYKQATEGPCNRPAPSVFTGRQKYANWRAWGNLFDMEKEEAMQLYIDQVRKIAPELFLTDSSAENLLAQEEQEEIEELEDDEKARRVADVSAEALKKRMDAASKNGGTIYLLTGATGFIGKHLLDRLSQRNANSLMICVTRAGSNIELAKIAMKSGYASQVAPIVGNIAKPNFELPGNVLDVLKSGGDGISHFFHLAASYDMNASEEVNRIANVDGTRNAIKLAELLKTKLEYISSIVVAGDYNGIFLESQFAEGQDFNNPYALTKYQAEKIVREECKARYRIYRPGIVVGHSATGEADKVDGPYYLFKSLQHLRKLLPSSLVLPCVEGETIPIVPVDYVVAAMDAIAHNIDENLDSRAYHLVDPSPETFLGALNIFAKAAHAPTFSSRVPNLLLSFLPQKMIGAASEIPLLQKAPHFLAHNVLGIPEANIDYIQFRTEYDDADTQEILAGTGIKCPPLKTYAWRLWDYYERYMDRSLDYNKALRQEVKGKTIVVTGASDGIGRMLAVRLARAGAVILLVARSKEKLAEVQKEILDHGGRAECYEADLSKEDSTNNMISKILKEHPKVDVLVNNAGRSIRRSVEYQYLGSGRFHDFTRCMDLNFYGSLRCILGFLPGMRERNSGQIINVSTIGALTNVPRFGAYVASKSALDGFTKCIAAEIARSDVVLSTIYMPLVKTKMIISAATDKGSDFQNAISTEEASALIERAIVTKERHIATTTGNLVAASRFLFPSLIESFLAFIYQLEPERAPEGQEDTKAASGDKGQLKAIQMLLKGAF